MADLECDGCGRDSNSGQDFLCVSCARSAIYLPRLETAKILLEKESMSKEIETATQPPSSTRSQPSRTKEHAHIAWQHEVAQAGKIAARIRIEQTRADVSTMRREIESMREEIAKCKATLIDRKNNLKTIDGILPARRQTTIETVAEIRHKGTVSFDTNNGRLLNTKAFLCRETASLLRLRLKKRMKDGVVKEQYTITGMLLPDLRDINTVRCTDLSAALNSIAHLLVLTAFYLGVRLPAEITTPHRNYPLATINTPANSYLGAKVAFPGSGSISTAPSSPFSSKHDIKSSHRPRPLFVGSDDRDEKVAQLAKRDPSAFNFFVEGIALLAWDIAWLRRSQGFTAGTTSWEDICNMGRNLSTLFAIPQSPAMQRVRSDRENRRRNSQLSSSPPARSPSTTGTSTPTGPSTAIAMASQSTAGKLASTSHHTTHSTALLTLPTNLELLKSWKLSKHQLISDALRKHLLTEMNNAEWEILQEQEWDDGGEAFEGATVGDTAVFVGGKKGLMTGDTVQNQIKPSNAGHHQDQHLLDNADDTAESPSTVATAVLTQKDGENTAPTTNAKGSGGRGWTKVRERDK